MTDEKIEQMQLGFDLLLNAARTISMLPLREWLDAFNRAETLGPFLDPTLYREYLFDKQRRGETLKELIQLALPLKNKFVELQSAAQNGTSDPTSSTSHVCMVDEKIEHI
jgi:hypothetical protein